MSIGRVFCDFRDNYEVYHSLRGEVCASHNVLDTIDYIVDSIYYVDNMILFVWARPRAMRGIEVFK